MTKAILLTAAALLVSVPAAAQERMEPAPPPAPTYTPAPDDPDSGMPDNTVVNSMPERSSADRELDRMMMSGDFGPDIAPEKRGDLSNCDGVDAQGVIDAIRTCQPVREAFLTMQPLITMSKENYDQSLDDPTGTGKMNDAVMDITDAIIKSAGDQTYPAEDIPLMMAHLFRMGVYEERGELGTALIEIDAALAIMDNTELTVAELKDSKPLHFIREMLALQLSQVKGDVEDDGDDGAK